MTSFGEQIRARRQELGMTQDDVAGQIRVSRATLAQWEGNRHRPSPENVRKLDEVFGARGDLIARREQSDDEQPDQIAPALFLSDVFAGVADALIDQLVEIDGRPAGWSHELGGPEPTPLSTAYVLRTLQMLDDARVDLHALADGILDRRQAGGWTNRPTADKEPDPPRPEVTGVILGTLFRLGRLADVDGELHALGALIDDYARTRPYILSVALEAVLTIRPDDPLATELIGLLLKARKQHEGRLLWTVRTDSPRQRVQPSLAHTARAAAVLRLAQRHRATDEIDGAVRDAIDWIVARDKDDDGTMEILRPEPDNRAADTPINHFTAAWVLRTLAGIEGVTAQRRAAAEAVVWSCYSPEDQLWTWRDVGSLPSWMTHDAVAALRLSSLTSTVTPVRPA